MVSMEAAAGDIIDFVPVDVICCILLWLPVSSLLRFKSVSKSWLSLIESSDFVDKHNNACSAKQQHQDPLIILTRPYYPYYPFSSDDPQQMSLFSFDLLLHNKQQHSTSEVSLDFPVVIDHYYQVNPVQMVASWNGIICLRQHRTVCLWNPATKQCTNLPPLPVVSSQGSVGFGFDPNTRDYKVVAINWACDGYVFHICSLSSYSWRKFEGLDLRNMDILSGIKAPYRGSVYCWLVSNVDNHHAVYMFDFSDEVFTSIPSPSSSIYVHDLFTITERIACVGKLRNEENTTYYEIWMLRDYRVEESWTKLYLIDLAPASETIQWMTNNGDLLLFLTGKQLCLYDLVTQQVTNLPVHITSNGYDVVVYRESMLSVKRGNGAANGLTSKMDCNRRMLINQSVIENSDWADSNVHRAVMFRILLWLPVLSLQRFKSACKLWCSLIKSSDFVTQHLVLHHHQHKQDNFSLILHSSYISDHPFVEDSSDHSPNTSPTCLLSADKLELLDLPTFDWLYITTSFNGIICLACARNYYGHVCLWNPATKQFRNLCPERVFNDGDDFHFGFGFDIKTNNYKLVSFSKGDDSFVQVYCLSTDSWRIIDDEILPTIWSISSGLDAPYRDEIYCWLVHTDPYSCAILSFDFSNEVFGTIPLPDSINKSSLTRGLAVLKDKIVCISLGEKYYSDDTENWHCEVWMMNEYGVKESWVQLYMVGPFSKDWCFKMCYSKKVGDYILLLKDEQLYEYNLVTQDIERHPCHIHGPKDYKVVAYEASLLPIK